MYQNKYKLEDPAHKNRARAIKQKSRIEFSQLLAESSSAKEKYYEEVQYGGDDNYNDESNSCIGEGEEGETFLTNLFTEVLAGVGNGAINGDDDNDDGKSEEADYADYLLEYSSGDSDSSADNNDDDKRRDDNNTEDNNIFFSSSDDDKNNSSDLEPEYDNKNDLARRGEMAKSFRDVAICGDCNNNNLDDGDKLIHRSSKMTVKQVAKNFSQIQSYFSMPKTASNAIFTLLTDMFPGIRLPTKITVNGRVEFSPEMFLGADQRDCEIHVCRRGCMAFINNYKENIKCRYCHSHRFHHCTQHKCRNADCNPFQQSGALGNHGINRRIPKRIVYYRSVIILLKVLAVESLELKFRTGTGNYDFPFSYGNEDDYHNDADSFVEDIAQSKFAKLHKRAMAKNYIKFTKDRAKCNDTRKYIDASFILSNFYDGGTLFRRKSRSVDPLLLTILNCNPYMRVKAGEGTFLISFHDLKVGCKAERTIFTELFVPELNLLKDGIPFSFFDNNRVEKHVFLQARLVNHVYDTPAMQDMFHVQGRVLIKAL